MRHRSLSRLALVTALALGLALPALAQFGRRYIPAASAPVDYNGQFVYAVDPTNEAFKFGVNYLRYGLTH